MPASHLPLLSCMTGERKNSLRDFSQAAFVGLIILRSAH
ncbi:hypothetical protein BACIH_0539 [Bacillus amyloliquefaciens]|nr:hypothetical protein BACIH_0539 [Bacillus amyloliquefaciens]